MSELSVSFAHWLPVFPRCRATLHLIKGQKKERELTDVTLADRCQEMSGRHFFFESSQTKAGRSQVVSGTVFS